MPLCLSIVTLHPMHGVVPQKSFHTQAQLRKTLASQSVFAAITSTNISGGDASQHIRLTQTRIFRDYCCKVGFIYAASPSNVCVHTSHHNAQAVILWRP